ncbi:hypothetical protein DV20_29825 [Amycolatopsis rifamycinica]|uniref:Insertion element IS402-like domain-containing protein n=1 Tax=Amycolatopsis rifamycinica TaxID=287986 RepID=A0A066TVB8_9PSEU|nr:hypothetical protein DV20_29825 [Amycolatopsis rifamycinica]
MSNGMWFKAKTGVAWRDLPERYGPWKTVYNRRGRAGGRPPAFDRAVYRCPNIVERCFNRFKQ